MLNELGSRPVSIGQVSPSQEHCDIWHLLSWWLALLPRATYGMCQGTDCLSRLHQGGVAQRSLLLLLTFNFPLKDRWKSLCFVAVNTAPLTTAKSSLCSVGQCPAQAAPGVRCLLTKMPHELSAVLTLARYDSGISFAAIPVPLPAHSLCWCWVEPGPCVGCQPLSPAAPQAAQTQSHSAFPFCARLPCGALLTAMATWLSSSWQPPAPPALLPLGFGVLCHPSACGCWC